MASPHPHFPNLFSPFSIKRVTIRNRVVISGHHASWWVDQGRPSAEFAAYIEERAKGGIGLFVIGCTSPEANSGWLENRDDSVIPAYRMCVDAAHRHGAAIFAQLCHPGYYPSGGTPIVMAPPSAPPTHPSYRSPKRYELTVEELKRLVVSFGQAAGRCIEGGIEGIELHSHEFFLHAQMLNPLWNTRTDEYGGSLENRMRFLVETLREMRRNIGSEAILGVRLKVDDMLQRGMDIAEYGEAVRRLDALGLVDYINFTCGDGSLHHGAMPREEGEWLSRIREIRKATKLPLMHAGHIATPQMAESAVKERITDFVCMTKTHIADPHFTRKVNENRLDDIRYCTRCLQSCLGAMHRMTCVYNPLTSRESIWSNLEPAARRKRVVIVGAGPAGMEAALTAAQRGHEVIVLERAERVGGQVWLGASSPLRKPWARIAEFYDRQSKKGLFEVRLNTEATAESIMSLSPDAVLLATGSSPIKWEGTAIQGAVPVVTVHEALDGAVDGAKHVLIYDKEGFNRPMVVADNLSSRGVEVDFVTPFLQVGPAMMDLVRHEFLTAFVERTVRYWPGYEIAGIEGNRKVNLRSVQTAEEAILPGDRGLDAIVAAVGSQAVNDLEHELRACVAELYVIGDANTPQTVEAATYQGARIGREL